LIVYVDCMLFFDFYVLSVGFSIVTSRSRFTVGIGDSSIDEISAIDIRSYF